MKTDERFTDEAITQLADAIRDAGGNEVCALGKLNKDGLVDELHIAARGDESCVLALDGFMDRGDVVIHNHPSGFLEPSAADLSVAARAGANGVGSYIVDNDVCDVYVVAEPARTRSLIAINPDVMASVLEKGGKLASGLSDYEPRESQLALIKSISAAMNGAYMLAAEAGTGVGKSFAYLIPAFAWAARNKERVVISTATINLQKQLIDKDIPKVISIFKKKLKAVLVKGRGNYVCLTRLAEALREESLFADTDDSPLRLLAAWAQKSASGDRADIAFSVDDALWARVRSESDECLSMRCPKRSECFVLKIKREAADADVLVANHHILFSDIAARNAGAGYEAAAVLPSYTTIIFDEAHAIENSATSFFSESLNKFSLAKQIGKLYKEYRNKKFGIVIKLQNIQNLPKGILKNFSKLSKRVTADMEEAERKALDCMNDEQAFRFVRGDDEEHSTRMQAAIDALGGLEKSLLAMAQMLKDAIDALPRDKETEQSAHEAELALTRLAALSGLCLKFRYFDEDPDSVYWCAKEKTASGDTFVTFRITPVSIAALMNEAVFSRYRSVHCLSATLSIGGSFAFWARRVGLSFSADRTVFELFPSPFPYEEHALLAAPDDAPLPDASEWQAYINKAVVKLIKASGGRALVLFTSYMSLSAAWDYAKPKLDAMGISAFKQGDGERTRLLASFKNDIASVLFATDSFWEGIDAPGETLQLVIITKLPFHVPTDPVQRARADAIEARGGNAFMDLSLPEAIIRFKQGFGRLIRHSDDIGVVAVLDVRLLKKPYGKMFIASLPSVQTCFGTLDETARRIRQFLHQKRKRHETVG